MTRDDLKDGGSAVFAETIRAIRRKNLFTTIEVLPSDMGGVDDNLQTSMDAKPDILNHNIETVRRLRREFVHEQLTIVHLSYYFVQKECNQYSNKIPLMLVLVKHMKRF